MPERTEPFGGTRSGERARHRALADPTRARMLELLDQAEGPLDAQTLAARLDLHLSTIRGHLKTLTDAELITAEREQRARPGRPRRLYSPSSEKPLPADAKSTLLLAQILATAISNSTPNPAETAEQAGRAWGRYLTPRPQPETRTPNRDAATQIAALHEDLGFNPTLRKRSGRYELCLGRCPFHDAATAYQEIICSAHRGLLHGTLATLHTNLTLETLTPFARPDRCLAHLTASP